MNFAKKEVKGLQIMLTGYEKVLTSQLCYDESAVISEGESTK